MSARALAIANQRDGAGKATTTVSLATSLASKGHHVLVVDLDPQGNTTTGSGTNKAIIENGIYQVVLGEADIPNAAIHSKESGYDVLSTNRILAGAEVELVQEIAREIRLKSALQLVTDNYDYILTDYPPSLILLTLNGLVATSGVIVPVLCEYYALKGVSDLVATVRKIRQVIDPDLDVTDIVRTMHDSRSRFVVEVSEQLRQHFGSLLFNAVVPHNIRLIEAPSRGLPALAYDARAKGTQAYLDLADELVARLER